MTDEQAMQRTLVLALRGSGHVSPNPRVGCVITKHGRVIAEGWHRAYGSLHAESDAIERATESVEGATLYVNLEPCAHQGKQPPCASLIIEKKLRRVVIGMEDPFHKVQGRGIAMLREAGIEVELGVLAEECAWANRAFTKYTTTGLPYIVAKTAQTLDGCIATSRGESQWITGEESRRRVHILRAELDAVLIGKSTAQTDNPTLDVRMVEGRNPKRIVFDTKLGLPLEIKLFSGADRANTIIVCDRKYTSTRKARNLAEAGVEVVGVETENERIAEKEALAVLAAEHNITSILLEGGGRLTSSFFDKRLIDEFHFFIAPNIMGGGKHIFENLGVNRLSNMPRFSVKFTAHSGDDLHVIAVYKS